MIPYGMVKTRSNGKDSTHRRCSICNPSVANKKKARQENKQIVLTEIKENYGFTS